MEKTYKVITENEFEEMYIEVFNKLENATKCYGKSISYGCKKCYLLETEIDYEISGGSCNKILSTYSREKTNGLNQHRSQNHGCRSAKSD